MNPPTISVVIPLYNEDESVPLLHQELTAVLGKLASTYEVVVVDDGSADQSFARLREIHERDPRWKVIRFRRNYGQTAGLDAGFKLAQGDYIVTIDADLQNNPQDIPRLLEKMDEGYDIVSGWRAARREPLITRRLPSMLANALISVVTGVKLHDYGCTLKVYRSEVVKNIELYGELHRFIPAIASSLGIRITEIPVDDRRRQFGRSNYGIWRTFRVILDLILVRFLFIYGTRPIQVFGGIGLVMGFVGGVIGLWLLYVKFILGQSIGSRPLFLVDILLIILGVQMIGLGLIGEIVLRNYHAAHPRTPYMVREQLGFDEQDS